MTIIRTAPVSQPNKDLIKAAEQFLADVRGGRLTDAVIVAFGEDVGDAWFHHHSIRDQPLMITMIGELNLYMDELRGQVHMVRQQAMQLRGAGSLSGVKS